MANSSEFFLVYSGEAYSPPSLSTFFPTLAEATLHAHWLMETHPGAKLFNYQWKKLSDFRWSVEDGDEITIQRKPLFETHAEWLAWVKERRQIV